MKIHEYQAKKILSKYGITCLRGKVAYTGEEAECIAKKLGGGPWIIKSQIHAGGRGKGTFKGKDMEGGGIRVVRSLTAVRENVRKMIGNILVTHQTGPEGKEVKRVYIEESCDIKCELYLGMLIDRTVGRITFIASREGGMSIEELAIDHPEKIIKISIDPAIGFKPFYGRKIAFSLGLKEKQTSLMVNLTQNLYNAFIGLDASIIEINPLVIDQNDNLVALDAKVEFDDNALFRHQDLNELRDESEENKAELEAAQHSLNYIKLDGQIGCMVNGAGLAMATMDIIKFYGASPANFLDVGGGATKERVSTAFKLILSDSNVEGILINIFGGIMRCDVIAEGVVAAAREISLNVPLVVRLEGTNVELGKRILSQSGLPIIAADNLADAAEKVVHAVMEAP